MCVIINKIPIVKEISYKAPECQGNGVYIHSNNINIQHHENN